MISCVVPNSEEDLLRYQQIGMNAASRTYIDGVYNCQNFATQFYKDCYFAGMRCRIRTGTAGGSGFSGGNHAWNSVFIGGKWVDWEPQINNVHIGHVKTATPGTAELSRFSYTQEDVLRLLYELVGRTVPSHIIDQGTVNDGLYNDGRYIAYLGGLCIDDGLTSDVLINNISFFRSNLPNNGNGGCYAIVENDTPIMITWVYKMNNKHYAVEHLQKSDLTAGRNIISHNIEHIFTESVKIIFIDLSNVIPNN